MVAMNLSIQRHHHLPKHPRQVDQVEPEPLENAGAKALDETQTGVLRRRTRGQLKLACFGRMSDDDIAAGD
jgi:hypothetical protein